MSRLYGVYIHLICIFFSGISMIVGFYYIEYPGYFAIFIVYLALLTDLVSASQRQIILMETTLMHSEKTEEIT